jgi:lipopolysaccharide heptosyltransferase I
MTRLLVVRLSALGDVIHTIPAVAALRETHEVSWVVEAPYRELVEIVAGVEAIPTRMKKWGKALIASRAEMGATLRAMSKADEAIDFQGLVKSAMLPWLARVKTRRGFSKNAIREKPALLFTNRKVRVDTSKHVIEQNLQLAGVAEGRANWSAYPQNNDLDAFANKIVLLPGAGKVNKLWPVERFAELAQRIGDDAIAVWGPGERELAEAIGTRIAPPTTLRELAFILQKARVVIGGDTGPLHLAAALGTKVIGLYGPTDPRRNGPYGQLDRCVDHFRSTKWMASISVEEVMTILQRISA